MENFAEKICPNCKNVINEGDAIRFDSMTGEKYHEACYEKMRGDSQIQSIESQVTGNNVQVQDIDIPKKKKHKKIFIIAIVSVVFAIVAAVIVILSLVTNSNVFVSVDELCEQGKYEEAYKKASSEDEKISVIAENAIAVLSVDIIDAMYDADSFKIRDGYYLGSVEDGVLKETVVIKEQGSNRLGGQTTSYCLFVYSEDDGCYKYWGSYSDISSESSDDFYDEICKGIIKGAVSGDVDTVKLDKTQINRINKMYEDDSLYDVEFINDDIIYSVFSEDEEI